MSSRCFNLMITQVVLTGVPQDMAVYDGKGHTKQA